MNQCFVGVVVKIHLYVTGVTTLVNVSNKAVWNVFFYIHIGFIDVFYFEKNPGKSCISSITVNVMYFFSIKLGFFYFQSGITGIDKAIVHTKFEPFAVLKSFLLSNCQHRK